MVDDTGSPSTTDPGSVSLPSSHYASTSPTPGISSLDGTPPYLSSPPPTTSPSESAVSISSPPHMDIKTAFLFQPITQDHHHGQINLDQGPAGQVLPPNMPRPSPSQQSIPEQIPSPADVRYEGAPLSEIGHLLRLQKYHRRRCLQAQERLHFLQIAAAKTARLSRAARSVQHTLAECIKAEDKDSFITLLHAFQDACNDSLRPTSSAILEAVPIASAESHPTSTFLEGLSASSRRTILDCLTKLRYDGAFVADRLASLSQKELSSLLPERTVARSSDSVFGNSARSSSRTSRPLGFTVDAQVDLLSSFAYASPLEALIYTPEDLSADDPLEERRAREVWSSACARLISEQKPGSERLVPAVLDIWTSSEPWPGKDRIGVWILQTLQTGSFLLEQQPNRRTFSARMEGQSATSVEEDEQADSFYSQAATSLLELFDSQTGASVLPPGALKMCHSISDKLCSPSGHERAFLYFVMTRWFTTLVMEVVTFPEAHGVLTDDYISEIARQRILREVVARAQKTVFAVSHRWKTGNVVLPETISLVNSVTSKLHGPGNNVPETSDQVQTGRALPADVCVAITAKDISTVLSALYPQRRPASVMSDFETSKSGLQSSASSTSGFSLFRHARSTSLIPSLTTSVSQEVQSSSIAHSDKLNTDGEEASQEDQSIRDAYLELDELVTRKSAYPGEFWDILSGPGIVGSLSMFLQDSGDIRKSVAAHDFTEFLQGATDPSSPEIQRCTRAIEVLLYKYGGDIPTSSLTSDTVSQTWNRLESLYEHAIATCQAKSDFVSAHRWFKQLHETHYLIFDTGHGKLLNKILKTIRETARKSADQSTILESTRDEMATSYRSCQTLRTDVLKPILEALDSFRDRMWYVSDVRTSAAYDEARSVTAALRTMGKPKTQQRNRPPPPLRHWSTPRPSSANMHLKSEAQALELLSARTEHTGPNKLSDEQAKILAQWMERQNIDNLCKGEERLHRMCMEVRRCVDQTMANATSDSASIWLNPLFSRDRDARQTPTAQRRTALFSGLGGNSGHSGYLWLSSQRRSNESLSNASHTLSSASSRDFFDSRSPTLTNRSSVPFWSPAMTEADSPSSATSMMSSQTQSATEVLHAKQPNGIAAHDQQMLDRLRQRVTSLLLSDITAVLFHDGSETDRAFWTGLGAELVEKHFRGTYTSSTSAGSQTPTASIIAPLRPSLTRFSFDNAFENLLQKFAAVCNPTMKLAYLYDIDKLLPSYMNDQRVNASPSESFTRDSSGVAQLAAETDQTEAVETTVSGFRHIFSKASLRPSTIFRDLQYIAALVPASTLQTTPQGKAFCNAAVAITSLKNEARAAMVETADTIIAYHSNNRGHGRSSSTAQQERDSATFSAPARTASAEDTARYSMADAAHLYQIAAKEGDIAAQRELATLYLTHPELMDHIIAPFARPRDVFKEELEGKWKKNKDPNRCDPATMCVANHWMSLSASGGDPLAKETIRQMEDMDSL